jgi:LEA14-like dessication related protein
MLELKNGRFFLRVLACSLAWLIVTGCQKPMAPEYLGLASSSVKTLNAQQTEILAYLKFYNPNQFHLQVKRAEMDILLNDKLADHYVLDSSVYVPQLDTFQVPIVLRLNLKSLLGNAMQILLTRQVKITLDGKIKIKRGLLPVKKRFHYEVNQRIDSLMPNLSF